MAEGIFTDKASKLGLNVEFDSCGTGDWHAGEAPDSRAQSCIQSNGGNIGHLRARQITADDLDAFDTVYTMDESNYNNVLSMCVSDQQRSKVKMLLNETYPGQNLSVPDPYFGGDSGFDHVYRLLDEASEKVLNTFV